jgi:hypothetical protein
MPPLNVEARPRGMTPTLGTIRNICMPSGDTSARFFQHVQSRRASVLRSPQPHARVGAFHDSHDGAFALSVPCDERACQACVSSFRERGSRSDDWMSGGL